MSGITESVPKTTGQRNCLRASMMQISERLKEDGSGRDVFPNRRVVLVKKLALMKNRSMFQSTVASESKGYSTIFRFVAVVT